MPSLNLKSAKNKLFTKYYGIGGLTIRVDSELPISDKTFQAKFKAFERPSAGHGVIRIRHRFGLPKIKDGCLGNLVYDKLPWVIYEQSDSWIYFNVLPDISFNAIVSIAIFNRDHTDGTIYHDSPDIFLSGNNASLTLMITDQILLARVLARRQGCIIHSCGAVLKGKGFLFSGHSGAGKSTLSAMLDRSGQVLCDDRIVVRKYAKQYKIFGTWSHGDFSVISPESARLEGIFFLRKSLRNKITRVTDAKLAAKLILAHVVEPVVCHEWWKDIFLFIETMSEKVPCYILEFDKSGKIMTHLKRMA